MTQRKAFRFDYYLPTLGSSWLIVALLIIGSLIFGLMLGFVQRISPEPVWKAQSLAYILTILVPLLFVWKMAGIARNASFGSEPAVRVNDPDFGSLGAPAFFVLTALALLALTTLVEPLTTLIPMPEHFKEVFRLAFVNTKLGDAILGTCILAPLFEELLCRGLMMRGMMQHLSPRSAILWSAFIFAFIHMNPWQAIPAFIFGVFFGWVYWKTRCLWATIFLHCLNNSFSTLLTRILPDLDVDEGIIDILPKDQYILLYIGCAAIFALCLALLVKKLPKREKNEQETISA